MKNRPTFDRRMLLHSMGAVFALAVTSSAADAAPIAKVKALGVLRVAVYKDNHPWSWNKEGQIVGIDVDLAKALAQSLGVRLDLAELAADESVDDDLRNAVWRGGLLGFAPVDVMLHVPFDRTFAARNDQVAIIAPYYRESFQFVCGNSDIDCDAAPSQFKGKKIAAELDSIPDFYLTGTGGGAIAKDVAHYLTGSEAVLAVAEGKADAVLASRAQIEAGLHDMPGRQLTRRKMPLPAFSSGGWDIGMAVKENSRSLGDAIEAELEKMIATGQLQAIFAAHGVKHVPPALV
ncbi:transporter substrate-binding domain-containing protein [soil metagenome]